MKFNRDYFILFKLLLMVEILIGLFMHDALIRPFGGDFLVVILLYCLVKSFINTPMLKTAMGVLLFSCLVEISQYFHLTAILGMQHSKVALLVLGSNFSFTDMLCYTIGIMLVIGLEKIRITLKISFN